jgi:hypothetical protein
VSKATGSAISESERLWNAIAGKKVNMVPIRSLTAEVRADRAGKINRYYRVEGPLAFFHVKLLDKGESGLMLYAILQRYWEATHSQKRSHIFLMSD